MSPFHAVLTALTTRAVHKSLAGMQEVIDGEVYREGGWRITRIPCVSRVSLANRAKRLATDNKEDTDFTEKYPRQRYPVGECPD